MGKTARRTGTNLLDDAGKSVGANIVVAHEADEYLCRRYNLTVSIEWHVAGFRTRPGTDGRYYRFCPGKQRPCDFLGRAVRLEDGGNGSGGNRREAFDPSARWKDLSDRQEETGGDYFSVMEEKPAAADRSFTVRSRHMNAIEIKICTFPWKGKC